MATLQLPQIRSARRSRGEPAKRQVVYSEARGRAVRGGAWVQAFARGKVASCFQVPAEDGHGLAAEEDAVVF
jgi:hypothetical protein